MDKSTAQQLRPVNAPKPTQGNPTHPPTDLPTGTHSPPHPQGPFFQTKKKTGTDGFTRPRAYIIPALHFSF